MCDTSNRSKLSQINRKNETTRQMGPTQIARKTNKLPYEVLSAVLISNWSDQFLNRIIACDEKWIMYDNWRRSAQWLNQNEAPKHFSKKKLHQKGNVDRLVVTSLSDSSQFFKSAKCRLRQKYTFVKSMKYINNISVRGQL